MDRRGRDFLGVAGVRLRARQQPAGGGSGGLGLVGGKFSASDAGDIRSLCLDSVSSLLAAGLMELTDGRICEIAFRGPRGRKMWSTNQSNVRQS